MTYAQEIKQRCDVQAIAAALRVQRFGPGDHLTIIRSRQGRWQVKPWRFLTFQEIKGRLGERTWPDGVECEAFAAALLSDYNCDAAM